VLSVSVSNYSHGDSTLSLSLCCSESPEITATPLVAIIVTIPPPYGRGQWAILRSVCQSVPWCSCLGYRHAGCLQLSHRRPPEMCGLRTRLRTDVDPPRCLPPSNCRRRGGGHIIAPPPGRFIVTLTSLVCGCVCIRPRVRRLQCTSTRWSMTWPRDCGKPLLNIMRSSGLPAISSSSSSQ